MKNALKTAQAKTFASFYKDPIITFAVYGVLYRIPYFYGTYVRYFLPNERSVRYTYVIFFELPYTVFCSERYGTHALHCSRPPGTNNYPLQRISKG